MSELIFTVVGIIVTALLGYIFKLKKDGRSKDDIINSIAKELTGVAKDSAEEKMGSSASLNAEMTKERIDFLNALEKAKREMDGVDEEDGAYDTEGRKPSSEAVEELDGLTSDPLEASSILKDTKELEDEIRRLAGEQTERLKDRLEGKD